MENFLNALISTWWGVLIIVLASVALFLLLSAALYRRFFKRFYDVLLSGLALLILSPLLIVLTVVGAIKMKGNPFFTQPRPGRINKRTGKESIFKLIKFRTMTNAKDEDGNLLPDEQRLNKYGKFLRSTSLDELPELINIFIGQMSIVGPRPLLVRDMVFMTDEQRKRHTVRQGLTGLAQVNGRNNVTWERKLQYDIEYVYGGISLLKDIKIVFQTVGKVFSRSDTVREGTASDIDLGDWLLIEGKVDKAEYDEKRERAKELIEVAKMRAIK